MLSRTLPASRTNRTGWLPSRDRRFRALVGCWRSAADRRSGSLPREISRRPCETWSQPGTGKQIKLVITIAWDWAIYEPGLSPLANPAERFPNYTVFVVGKRRGNSTKSPAKITQTNKDYMTQYHDEFCTSQRALEKNCENKLRTTTTSKRNRSKPPCIEAGERYMRRNQDLVPFSLFAEPFERDSNNVSSNVTRIQCCRRISSLRHEHRTLCSDARVSKPRRLMTRFTLKTLQWHILTWPLQLRVYLFTWSLWLSAWASTKQDE